MNALLKSLIFQSLSHGVGAGTEPVGSNELYCVNYTQSALKTPQPRFSLLRYPLVQALFSIFFCLLWSGPPFIVLKAEEVSVSQDPLDEWLGLRDSTEAKCVLSSWQCQGCAGVDFHGLLTGKKGSYLLCQETAFDCSVV